ncbi:MAG: hypothetical protein P1P64_07975 [Treponemataceae bacterium]
MRKRYSRHGRRANTKQLRCFATSKVFKVAKLDHLEKTRTFFQGELWMGERFVTSR